MVGTNDHTPGEGPLLREDGEVDDEEEDGASEVDINNDSINEPIPINNLFSSLLLVTDDEVVVGDGDDLAPDGADGTDARGLLQISHREEVSSLRKVHEEHDQLMLSSELSPSNQHHSITITISIIEDRYMERKERSLTENS